MARTCAPLAVHAARKQVRRTLATLWRRMLAHPAPIHSCFGRFLLRRLLAGLCCLSTMRALLLPSGCEIVRTVAPALALDGGCRTNRARCGGPQRRPSGRSIRGAASAWLRGHRPAHLDVHWRMRQRNRTTAALCDSLRPERASDSGDSPTLACGTKGGLSRGLREVHVAVPESHGQAQRLRCGCPSRRGGATRSRLCAPATRGSGPEHRRRRPLPFSVGRTRSRSTDR
jgi:hypothetical protein